MAEDDDAQVDGELDEDRDAGAEGDGAGGEDSTGRDEEGDLHAEQSDAEGDDGEPPARRPAQPEAQQGRSARERYQRLANENRELRERQDRLEREREQERQLWNQRQNQAHEQQERERLNLMTPEERFEYLRNQDRTQLTQQMRQFQMQTAAQIDKSTFDARCATSPARRRMRDEVEKRFTEQMRIGQPTDRETIYFYLLGQQADRGASNAAPQRRAARKRVEQEKVPSSSNRSSAPSGTSRGTGRMSTAEERLKDVLI